MNLEEKTLSSEPLTEGKFLKAWRDCVELPNGHTAYREYIKHPGAVVIIAVQDDGKLLFERQFRYPLHRVFVELPAGKIDPGEPILQCAQRELKEETSFLAREWQYLGVFHPCIGYSDERIEVFIARGLEKLPGCHLDEDEFLEVFAMTYAEALEEIRAGRLTDGKTLSALMLAAPWLN